MIDPIIFTIDIGSLHLPIRWYGIILVTAMLIGTWIADKEFQRRGGPAEELWNALIPVLISGLIGARIWYIINTTLGGNMYYINEPARMLAFTEGGLHIFGGFIFGGTAAFIYARRNQLDWLMILDSIAPSLLISQALARPANFINQELYGPPTDLPWGIPIEQGSRIGEWRDMDLFPFETTRFHPTFAYEMVWNLLTGGILLYLVRKYPERFKPGSVFALWLILAGVGRFIVEAFRPDQPTIGDTTLSYSRLISGLMAVVGVVWMLVRTERLKLSWWKPGPDNYFIAKRWIKLAKDKERAKQKEEQLAKRQAAKSAKGGKGGKRKGAK